MEVIKAIIERRSIRSYKTDPVSEKDLKTVLEAGRWAPSWANTRCCRFVVVRDEAIKAKIADMMKANRAAGGIRLAPVLIAAVAELGKSGYCAGRAATDKGDWFMFDSALAMQNMVLAAHSLGLATVYVGNFDAAKAAKTLGVPPGFALVALTPLGYPNEKAEAPPRKSLSEIVFRDRFGSFYYDKE